MITSKTSNLSHQLNEIDFDVLIEVLSASSDACWCMEFGTPVDLTTPDHEVIRQVFENAPHWRLSNKAMAELYLLPAKENFNDRPVREIFPRNKKNEEFIATLIANGFEVDRSPALDKRYDGLEIYVENDVRAHIKNGQLIRMFGIVRDVGKHRRKQMRLEAEIANLEATINALPLPVLAVSENDIVISANQAARKAASRQDIEINGCNVASLIADISGADAVESVMSELKQLTQRGVPTSKKIYGSSARFDWHISSMAASGTIKAVLTALPIAEAKK